MKPMRAIEYPIQATAVSIRFLTPSSMEASYTNSCPAALSKSLLSLRLDGYQVVSRFLPAIRAFQFAATESGLRSDRKKIVQESSLRYLRVYEA
jgi:hypothetical protein